MKKPVLHGMAARLYPDCGKRFSWSGCVEWEVLTPHIFPQRKSSKLGTSPHIWVLVRCMAALPFFTLLLSLQFVPLCVFHDQKSILWGDFDVIWCSQVFVLWGQAGLHELEIVPTSNRVQPHPCGFCLKSSVPRLGKHPRSKINRKCKASRWGAFGVILLDVDVEWCSLVPLTAQL